MPSLLDHTRGTAGDLTPLERGLVVRVPVTLTGGTQLHEWNPTRAANVVRVREHRRVVDEYSVRDRCEFLSRGTDAPTIAPGREGASVPTIGVRRVRASDALDAIIRELHHAGQDRPGSVELSALDNDAPQDPKGPMAPDAQLHSATGQDPRDVFLDRCTIVTLGFTVAPNSLGVEA